MRLFLPINGNKRFTALCREYPNNLGYIIGPSYYQKPKEGIAFVADNDAFKYWREKCPFGVSEWTDMIGKIDKSGLNPLWVVIPDSVCDRDGTLKNWEKFSPMINGYKRRSCFRTA